jgi:hypothetical protein
VCTIASRYGCEGPLSYESIPVHLRRPISQKVRELCAQEVDEMMRRDRHFAEEVSRMQAARAAAEGQSFSQVGLHPCTHWILSTILLTSSVYMFFVVLIAFWFQWAEMGWPLPW